MQNNKHLWTSLLVGLVIAGGAIAGSVTIPNTFTAGTPARAAEVNANFAAVKTAVDDNDARLTTLLAARTYTAPTFGTGWADVGGAYQPVGFTKDSLGFVHIRGIVRRNSGTGVEVFTLPAGYRPPALLQFPSRGGGDLCYIQVHPTGLVEFGGPTTANPSTSVTLDGIVFDPA